MNRSLLKKFTLISFLMSFLVGAALVGHSDSPPYGDAGNELSNCGWGLIVDTAHKWRNFNFSFWDRGVGGGCSLFTSGQYPILDPFNFTAWFLNDDQFYLFALVIPYVVGFFFTTLLLSEIFQLRWPYVFFGAFAYAGLWLGNWAVLSQQPVLLWGPMLFPAMIYAYLKLKERDPLLAAAAIGALVAFQFALGGVIEFPQIIAWWLIFYFIALLSAFRRGAAFTQIKMWLICSFLLVLMSVGIMAVQFIPTYHFSFTESARLPGYYPINNFAIFPGQNPNLTLWEIVRLALFQEGTVSSGGLLSLWVMLPALLIANPGKSFFSEKQKQHKAFLKNLWLATLVYFLVPTAAEMISSWVPALSRLFLPLTQFTFRYGVHTLDFVMTLTLCLVLSREDLSLGKCSPARKIASRILFFIAVIIILAPVVLALVPGSKAAIISFLPFFQKFIPASLANAFAVFLLCFFILFQLAFRKKQKIFWIVFAIALPLFGFSRTLISYHWNSKGRQTHIADYHFQSPETKYYMAAKGKYFLPYDTYVAMSQNFNLLYGVHGTAGFLPVPPIRFNRFMTGYRQTPANDAVSDSGKFSSIFKYDIIRPSEELTTYFPVDFTTVLQGTDLPWKSFSKRISGEFYDIWERREKTARVKFAGNLECLTFREAMQRFEDTPFRDSVFALQEDCGAFGLEEGSLSVGVANQKQKYEEFKQSPEDRITFSLSLSHPAYVVVPEMYQRGWVGKANGQKLEIFPANYLFLGFRLPPGSYRVELNFVPPLFYLGLIVNVIALAILLMLIVRYVRREIPRTPERQKT